VIDRTNVRSIDAEKIGGPVELVVADLSFISLKLVLPAFVACVAPGGDLLPMVKPQFEVGKDRVGSGGVVRDPALRTEAVLEVAREAQQQGLRTLGAVASPLPGPSGNVEYFLWLRAGAPGTEELDPAVIELIERAVQEGPQ
jgi:23S rRNA (cytidine1920-2'-O)/16S rRNA (cytidine1409-2'-O)-methyltransferase